MGAEKIRSFTDLVAWQKGHGLVLSVYQATSKFPKEEVFGLTNQMRRAAVSITSNIAEGFSRSTNKDKVQFYTMAMGSLTELQNQVMIARDVEYIDQRDYSPLEEKIITVGKLISGLKRIRDSAPSY